MEAHLALKQAVPRSPRWHSVHRALTTDPTKLVCGHREAELDAGGDREEIRIPLQRTPLAQGNQRCSGTQPVYFSCCGQVPSNTCKPEVGSCEAWPLLSPCVPRSPVPDGSKGSAYKAAFESCCNRYHGLPVHKLSWSGKGTQGITWQLKVRIPVTIVV